MNTVTSKIMIFAVVFIIALQRESFSIIQNIDFKTLLNYEYKPAVQPIAGHNWYENNGWRFNNVVKKKILIFRQLKLKMIQISIKNHVLCAW